MAPALDHNIDYIRAEDGRCRLPSSTIDDGFNPCLAAECEFRMERTNERSLFASEQNKGRLVCLANTFTIQIRHVLRGLAYLVFEEETFCDFMSDSLKIIVVFEKSLHESKMILKLCDTFAKRWGVNWYYFRR